MKKYIILFLKRRLFTVFASATLFFLIFFLPLLFCKNAVYSPFSAFWIYVVALIWYVVDIFFTIRFQILIRYQEKQFGIIFNDANAIPLFPKSSTFLSDDWLIFAGKTAFCRQYIDNIQDKTKRNSMGNDCFLKIHTNDNKTFTVMMDSRTNSKKIQQWYKRS